MKFQQIKILAQKAVFASLAVATLAGLYGCNEISDWRSQNSENARRGLTGYCFDQDRYLSNRELTDLAVEILMENLQTRYDALSESEKANTINYSSIEKFHKINPKCCPIIAKPGDLEFAKARIEKFKKHGTYDIIGNNISSRINYQLEKAGEKKYRTYRYSMRFCGDHIGPPKSKHAVGQKAGRSHY